MPDTASQRGRSLELAAGLQTDFVTPLAAGLSRYTCYEESVVTSEAMTDDNELGLDTHDDRSPTDPAPGANGGQGSIVIPADLNQLGFWLTLLLGAPDTTDNQDGSFTHVFETGSDLLPCATVQRQLGPERWKVIEGLKLNSFAFGVNKSEDGYRTFRLDCMARRVRVVSQAGAPIDAAPAALPARAKLPAKRGLARLNTVVQGNLMSGEFTLANNLERVDYADAADAAGELASDFEPGELALTGSPTFRFKKGAALNGALDVFDNERTPFALEVEYALSAAAGLLVAAPRCFAPPVTPPVTGPGPVDFSADVTARQTTGETPAPLATFTLTCGVETWA